MKSTYAWSDEFIALPPRLDEGARATIRAAHQWNGRRILVLDDDPTGSQAVHDVSVVTSFELEPIERALAEAGSTCFVLTNSRSLPVAEATQLSHDLGLLAFELEDRLGGPVEIVSRSDSTLRGHVVEELQALNAARLEACGAGYDGFIFLPSFFEAGRFTAENVHWARVGGEILAVGDTEFARDATFGYENSDLRKFIEEKSGGSVHAADVVAISLEDIRIGGPDRVAQILGEVTGGQFVVVNAVEYADLEVATLGLLQAEAAGSTFAFRSGPSFVQILPGLDAAPPLNAESIWPGEKTPGRGLIVVGSHVGLTNRQVERCEQLSEIEKITIDVDGLLDAGRFDTVVADCIEQANTALIDHDALMVTSRLLRTGSDPDESLHIARRVSTGLVAIVSGILAKRPAFLIAKGGITSHDLMVRALGVHRAVVIGQLFPGFVSVFRPVEALPEAVGMPFIVFAGNVGDDSSLATAVEKLRGAA